MTSRQKESVAGKEKRVVSPMDSSTPTERRRSLIPSTLPGAAAAKDHGKAPAKTSSPGEPRKHVPNYLKPTISSSPNAAKHTAATKLAHDDTHKPTSKMMRRRSFDRPEPASQVQRAVQSSSSRGERTTPPFSPKHSAAGTRPTSSSSDRISKVVKAVKSQPPFLKTKSMPRTSSNSGAKKEVKTSSLKKATPSTEEEPVHAPKTIESEAGDQESSDPNVEEELTKMDSPADFPPEKHFAEDKEHIDEENHSPKECFDENKETLDAVETTVTEDHQNEQEHEHTPESVAENTENVEVTHEGIQVVHESQDTDETDQQTSQVVNEAPAGDADIKEDEKDENKETLDAVETTVSEDHQDEQEDEQEQEQEQEHEHTPEPVAENTENVEVTQEDIQVVHGSQDTDESDQQTSQVVNEAPAGDADIKEDEKETIEEIKPVGLTVKTTPDEKDEEAVEAEQGQHDSEEGDERQNSKEPVHKIDEEEKPAKSETENVVHKRQVGGPRNKKESPAYNDVIEETASKLVEKRVNKVRALAGAFETVISLQQPDSR